MSALADLTDHERAEYDRASDQDREWFAHHPGRRYRLRPAKPSEARLLAPRGKATHVLIVKVHDLCRVRRAVLWTIPGPTPTTTLCSTGWPLASRSLAEVGTHERARPHPPRNRRARAPSAQRFVGWRWETRNGKPTKPPIDPHTGGYADTTNPATWADLGTAMAAVERYQLDGVGPVLDAATRRYCRHRLGRLPRCRHRRDRGLGHEDHPQHQLLHRDFTERDRRQDLLPRRSGAEAGGQQAHASARPTAPSRRASRSTPAAATSASQARSSTACPTRSSTPPRHWSGSPRGSPRKSPAPELPAAFAAMLERDAKLREAWENGRQDRPRRRRQRVRARLVPGLLPAPPPRRW